MCFKILEGVYQNCNDGNKGQIKEGKEEKNEGRVTKNEVMSQSYSRWFITMNNLKK